MFNYCVWLWQYVKEQKRCFSVLWTGAVLLRGALTCTVFTIASNMAERVHEHGPSTSKRRKIDSCLSPSLVSPIILDDLSTAIFTLCSSKSMLLPYKVTSSNAASPVSFSKAFCEQENLDRGFILGDVFRRGINIAIDFLHGNIPEAKHEKIILEKLVKILKLGGRLVGYFLLSVSGPKAKVEIKKSMERQVT